MQKLDMGQDGNQNIHVINSFKKSKRQNFSSEKSFCKSDVLGRAPCLVCSPPASSLSAEYCRDTLNMQVCPDYCNGTYLYYKNSASLHLKFKFKCKLSFCWHCWWWWGTQVCMCRHFCLLGEESMQIWLWLSSRREQREAAEGCYWLVLLFCLPGGCAPPLCYINSEPMENIQSGPQLSACLGQSRFSRWPLIKYFG